MRTAIDYLTQNLANAPAVQAIVGEDCYLVAAPQDIEKNNFIAYTLSKRNTGSKDAHEYDVRVSVCNNTIAAVVTNGDVVEDHLAFLDKIIFEGTSEIAFVQDQFYQLDYNFILTI